MTFLSVLSTLSMVAQSQFLINSKYPKIKLQAGQFEPIVLVHGGAGDIPDSRDMGKHRGTRMAVRLGYDKLKSGGSALDAVEAAVRSMELDENFNCGYGSVLNWDGDVAMDASVMNGADLDAGCVTLINDILHPITLARMVMERTNHTFLGGEGAMRFAKQENVQILNPPGQLATQAGKDALAAYKKDKISGQETGHNSAASSSVPQQKTAAIPVEVSKYQAALIKDYGEVGTVGAVAIDQYGNVAAATSTGGMTGKLPGRIGDSPLLGSGTMADNRSGAVSVTGNGEIIMRFQVASRILQRIEYLNESAAVATAKVLEEMTSRLVQTAGAITIDRNGEIGMHWTSEKMAWAYRKGDTVHYGIKHGEDLVEKA